MTTTDQAGPLPDEPTRSEGSSGRGSRPSPEVRAGWLSRWVGRLHEFASPDLQRRVWVEAAVPNYMSSHTELMCCYFDDLGLSREGGVGVAYRFAIEDGLVTAAEAAAVDHFHRVASGYAARYERDAAYLSDPAWLAVAALAADAWHRLKGVARPEVLALMQAGEEAFGEVARGRSWEKCGDWIEADLTVLAAAEGGRQHAVFTGYRPDWQIGNRVPGGHVTINGAQVSVDREPIGPGFGEKRIEPGGSGLVRLFPLAPELWHRVHVGQRIKMCEGPHVVGVAVVRELGLTPPFLTGVAYSKGAHDMASRTDTESHSDNPILLALCAAFGAVIGVGIVSSWTLPRMIPAAVSASVAMVVFKVAIARRVPTWLRFLGSVAIGVGLAYASHLLLSLR